MFLKKRIANNSLYWSIAESFREDGKVKQKIVKNLGNTEKAYQILLESPNKEHKKFLYQIANYITPVINKKMKMIDLFSGIGGFSLAADWAEIETVAFCERDPFCHKVLNKHWKDVPIFDDISRLNKTILIESGVINIDEHIDIICGGFPCQPYSIAGKKKGNQDDRHLWPEMFRVIKEIRPTWVIGENVANFSNMELDNTLLDLESIGYSTKSFIIPACSVGAPHKRDRTWILAYTNSKYGEAAALHPRTIKESETKKHPEWEQIFYVNNGNNNIEFREEDQSKLCRNDDGISPGLDEDRLRTLGNAVVPQQVFPFFQLISNIHSCMLEETILIKESMS
jgi:DNA (cytosine-5)-methyltransferase 1